MGGGRSHGLAQWHSAATAGAHRPVPDGADPALRVGVRGGMAPLLPGQYVLEIRANATKGFRVDTTYHLESEGP